MCVRTGIQIRGHLEVGCLLPLCGSQELHSGCQVGSSGIYLGSVDSESGTRCTISLARGHIFDCYETGSHFVALGGLELTK